MKKRYIYSSLLSGLLFIILYIALDFNILISLILTVFAYVGGIFFFKEKDVRKYDPNLIMHYCYLISKAANYGSLIKNKDISKEIKDITDEAQQVVTMLEQKPNKVTQVYDSFDYFLPLTIKVIEQYIEITKKEELTEEEKKFESNMKSFCDGIEDEIKKLIENMNYTKMLDINSNIEVFKKENNIVNSGLLKKETTENKE